MISWVMISTFTWRYNPKNSFQTIADGQWASCGFEWLTGKYIYPLASKTIQKWIIFRQKSQNSTNWNQIQFVDWESFYARYFSQNPVIELIRVITWRIALAWRKFTIENTMLEKVKLTFGSIEKNLNLKWIVFGKYGWLRNGDVIFGQMFLN